MLLFPPEQTPVGRDRAAYFALLRHLVAAHGADVPGTRNHLEAAHERLHGGLRDPHPVLVIVSGGQTGVDRAALDWALANGFAHAGWCPLGRLAEDGPIPARYQLKELRSPSYPARTRRNVLDTDATLIFSESTRLSRGTKLTVDTAAKAGRPCLILTPAAADPSGELAAWLAQHRPLWLNVAGSRLSTAPELPAFVDRTLSGALAAAPQHVA